MTAKTSTPESDLPATVTPPDMTVDPAERSAIEREREDADGIVGYEAAKEAATEPERKTKSKK